MFKTNFSGHKKLGENKKFRGSLPRKPSHGYGPGTRAKLLPVEQPLSDNKFSFRNVFITTDNINTVFSTSAFNIKIFPIDLDME